MSSPGSSGGGSTGAQVKPTTSSDSNIEARLAKVESILGIQPSKTPNSALGAGLIGGLINEGIQEIAPDLIQDVRTIVRQRLGLPATSPAPSAPTPSAPTPSVPSAPTPAPNNPPAGLTKTDVQQMLDAQMDKISKLIDQKIEAAKPK